MGVSYLIDDPGRSERPQCLFHGEKLVRDRDVVAPGYTGDAGLSPEMEILSYERTKEVIRSLSGIAVTQCICRK